MEPKEIFAQRIRELRLKRHLSMNKLASDLDTDHANISYYENNKREPTVGVLKKFADYFGVTCDYLLGMTDYPYKKECCNHAETKETKS